MATSTKWRIRITGPEDFGGGFLFGEIWMAATVGGPNLIGTGSVTVSSVLETTHPDAVYKIGLASYAVDGVLHTAGSGYEAWGAYNGVPQWIAYEFAAPITIEQYGINPFSSGGGGDPLYTGWLSWDFQYYDGASWVTVDTRVEEPLAYNGMSFFTVDPDPATIRTTQMVVEVLRDNGADITIRATQLVAEVIRTNGLEATGGTLDPIPGENPVFSTWFMMF